eukprot:gene10962-28335_t
MRAAPPASHKGGKGWEGTGAAHGATPYPPPPSKGGAGKGGKGRAPKGGKGRDGGEPAAAGWRCVRCGFRNRAVNAVCGGAGSLGCKAAPDGVVDADA